MSRLRKPAAGGCRAVSDVVQGLDVQGSGGEPEGVTDVAVELVDKGMTLRADDDTSTRSINGEGQVIPPGDKSTESTEGSINGDDLASGDDLAPGDGGRALDVKEVINKLDIVSTLLKKLDAKSDTTSGTVRELQTSLEYSQAEIDTLKGENNKLKQRLADLETEERRSTFHQKRIEEKVDRVDTANKRKNLVLEGVPETEGGKEDVVKTVWSVFDQLNMERAIELDSCYRTGSSGGGRPRPITVVFVKQADRDLVYSRRMELKRSLNHKQVWINEDLGPASKKARNMIRLISRQAQGEGIDHRTGKYAIFINRRKYDESNLTDLPPPP